MRFLAFTLGVLALLAAPTASHAIGVEAALGGWAQSPSGIFSYQYLGVDDNLDLEKDAGFDTGLAPFARVKLDMPLIIPNVYLMVTPMSFEGTGTKTVTFKFGDFTFDSAVPFDAELVLDQYDIALYYGVPFLELVTMGMLNVEAGLNLRLIDLSASIEGESGGLPVTESVSLTLPVPMLYVGAQLRPTETIAVEAELRAIKYSDNHYLDAIARVKYRVMSLFFVSVGYRHQDLKIDKDGMRAEVNFSGPFVEAGIEL